MKLYYECQLFNQDVDISQPFEVEQQELVFRKIISAKKRKFSFAPVKVTYKCNFHKSENFSSIKPTIILPIKDNHELLEYTLENFYDNNIIKHCNILIVDDRSEEDHIRNISIDHGHSYLRVDNRKGFNFSMLNNIAAKICYQLKNNTIIMWNSDLWTKDESSFLELIKRHNQDGSKISGSKLVYPPVSISLNKEPDSPNIKNYFPGLKNGKWRNTVQFGGDSWFYSPSRPIVHSPVHFKRFTAIHNPLVNCDRGSLFVTGALHVYDLEFFIGLGGLNPSLSKVFQDTDICLRAYEKRHCPMYYGKNLYFYHDESLSTSGKTGKEKEDGQFHSDHYLFGKIWNNKIGKFLGIGIN